MEKNVASTFQGFAAAFHQFFPTLAKDLDRHVRWNPPLINEATAEIELDLGSRRESDFDLFETDLRQHLKEAEFFRDIHRLSQGLIAVPEVDTAPDGRSFDHAVGPLSIGEKDWLKRTIFCQGRELHK